jgi:MoxR-like ATPase
MALTDPNVAREPIRRLYYQPLEFLFGDGLKRATYKTVMALLTPMLKDSKKGKEWVQAHSIIIDLPGKGKTALYVYITASLDAKLGKIEGRADMLPHELTGKEETNRFTGKRTVYKGPLFSHVFFFDEINRTPPKAQSPALGAMEGAHCILNVTNEETGFTEPVEFSLFPIPDDPRGRNFFSVFATMNPIEIEGTYPLSEAQMDRITYSGSMGSASREDQKKIRGENVMDKKIEKIMNLSELLDIHDMVKQIHLSSEADELIQRYLENSRPYSQDIFDSGKILPRRYATKNLVSHLNKYVLAGCSDRRNYHMQYAAIAHRFMRLMFDPLNKEIGDLSKIRAEVDDVKAIAPSTMEHVIRLSPYALGDNVTAKSVISKIIEGTQIP